MFLIKVSSVISCYYLFTRFSENSLKFSIVYKYIQEIHEFTNIFIYYANFQWTLDENIINMMSLENLHFIIPNLIRGFQFKLISLKFKLLFTFKVILKYKRKKVRVFTKNYCTKIYKIALYTFQHKCSNRCKEAFPIISNNRLTKW